MSSKDKTLATFQIDRSKWTKFKKLAGNQSASSVLVQFIEKFLDNPRILEQSNYSETSKIEYQSIMDSRIKAIENQLSVIEAHDKELTVDLRANYITNLELTEILDRLKTLEDKLSDIEESNKESVTNSATESINNLENRYKELEARLIVIEKANYQLATNLAIESINNLEANLPSSITENINIEERDNQVREALEQAESKGKVIKKQIYQKAAELLNQWEVLDKSGNQGKWTWTKVRDYFKK